MHPLLVTHKSEHKRLFSKTLKNLTDPKQFNVSVYEILRYLLLEWKKIAQVV